jgi:uncharacterized protein
VTGTIVVSEDRQNHLAHIIVDGIWKDDLIDYTDDDLAIRAAKLAVAAWVKEELELDGVVRAKVASLKRNVLEGTPEWDVMYSKYYEEESRKRGSK